MLSLNYQRISLFFHIFYYFYFNFGVLYILFVFLIFFPHRLVSKMFQECSLMAWWPVPNPINCSINKVLIGIQVIVCYVFFQLASFLPFG